LTLRHVNRDRFYYFYYYYKHCSEVEQFILVQCLNIVI